MLHLCAPGMFEGEQVPHTFVWTGLQHALVVGSTDSSAVLTQTKVTAYVTMTR